MFLKSNAINIPTINGTINSKVIAATIHSESKLLALYAIFKFSLFIFLFSQNGIFSSCDALASHQQILNPDYQHNIIYTCSSECSEHSLRQAIRCPRHYHPKKKKLSEVSERGRENAPIISTTHEYEYNRNDDYSTNDKLIEQNSDCYASREDTDTCCSCSEESSCVYAETNDPSQ